MPSCRLGCEAERRRSPTRRTCPSECGYSSAVQALDRAVAADADAAGEARSVAVERDDQRLVEAARVDTRSPRGSAWCSTRFSFVAEPKFARAPTRAPRATCGGTCRRVTAPLGRAALGDVARDDAFARRGRDRRASWRGPSPSARSASRRPGIGAVAVRHPRARPRAASRCVASGAAVVEELALVREVALEQPRLLLPAEERIATTSMSSARVPVASSAFCERLPGKAVLQLHPGEAFLSGGVRDLPVFDKRDRRVLVEGREPESPSCERLLQASATHENPRSCRGLRPARREKTRSRRRCGRETPGVRQRSGRTACARLDRRAVQRQRERPHPVGAAARA